jgi:hypothetical protein
MEIPFQETQFLVPVVVWCSIGGTRTMELVLPLLVVTKRQILYRERRTIMMISMVWATSSALIHDLDRRAQNGGTMLPKSKEIAMDLHAK